MKKRSLLALILSLAISVCAAGSVAYGDDRVPWIPQLAIQNDLSYHGVIFEDPAFLRFDFSLLQGADNNGNLFTCKSSTDPHCANMNLKYSSVLKPCETSGETNCIESLAAIDTSSTVTTAHFEKYTVTNHYNDYPADLRLGIPQGSMPSIWSIPTAPHAGGDLYAVIADLSGMVSPEGKANPGYSSFSVSLVPVTLKDFGTGRGTQAENWEGVVPNIYYDFCSEFQQLPTRVNADCAHVDGPDCLLPTNIQGQCYEKEEFTTNDRFKVKLRLATEPTGWLHGRMVDPDISITKDPTQGVDLTVAAGNIEVPMVYQGADWDSLPPALQQFWVDCTKHGDDCAQGYFGGPQAKPNFWDLAGTLDGNKQVNMTLLPYASGNYALSAVTALAPLVGNKAYAMTTSWSFRSLTSGEMSGADSCFKSTSGIKGIVTTNSMAYSAGPPSFANGTLNYKVSSTHFNPDGSVFKGSYNLGIRSDVARCLYGFTSAPINATISITGENGTPEVATTVVGEKNGWLYLSANNFEFSAPTVQVKLSQDAPATLSSPAKTATKQAAITCIKGKISKLVKGNTCPTGYRKK